MKSGEENGGNYKRSGKETSTTVCKVEPHDNKLIFAL